MRTTALRGGKGEKGQSRGGSGEEKEEDALVSTVIAFSDECSKLGIEQVASLVDMALRLVELAAMNRENRPEPCSVRRVVLHDPDVDVHRLPLSETPRSGGGERSDLASHVVPDSSPVLLGELGERLPFSEGVKTPHPSDSDVERVGLLLRLALKSGEGVLPPFELDVPLLLELEIVDLVSVREDTDRDVGLLKRVVDADELLDGLHRRVGENLELLVVESFGVGSTLHRILAERRDGDGENFIVVLHELGEVEEGLGDFGREGVRSEGDGDGANEFFLLDKKRVSESQRRERRRERAWYWS
jgi:hypothetical protein